MSSWIGCIQQLLGRALKRGELKPHLQLLVWFPGPSGLHFQGGQGLGTKLSNNCTVAVITNIDLFTLSYTCIEAIRIILVTHVRKCSAIQ